MNPMLLFTLAIFTPVMFAGTILVPPYVGIVAASYIIYYKSGEVHPLAGKLDDISYMIDVYSQLLTQWAHNIAQTSVLSYALPLLLLPIFGIMLTLWLSQKVARKLKDIFQNSASI